MQSLKTLLMSSIVALSMATSFSALAQSSGMPADKKAEVFEALNRGVPHVANEMLVQFSATATQSDKARALRLIVGQRKEVVVPKAKQSLPNSARSVLGDLELVTLPRGLAVSSAMRSIERDPAVLFAEPNWIYQHQATSDDPYVTGNNLWGMTGTFGSQAASAWTNNKTDCGSVYVGIIDEGYYIGHEDLAANVGTNPGETGDGRETNNLDDDGNGLKDDVYGWDYVANDKSVFDGSGDDHGTHVAGTIGGVGKNNKGVAGICWNVKLLNAKFLGSNGGTTDNAVKAVNYFTDLKKFRGVNVIATNNSWGGGGYSAALKTAIDNAGAEGILFVAAAGNSKRNIDKVLSYPAAYTSNNLISVAAIDSAGRLASFSNYGATMVDLGAPGVSIISTVPTNCSGTNCSSGYASYNGTSMAAPHVTGAVALYSAHYARNSNEPASDYALRIKDAILAAGTQTTALVGKTSTGDRLNIGGF